MSRCKDIPCWRVAWQIEKSSQIFDRMFYADHGKTYEDAMAWIMELGKSPENKNIKLEVGTYNGSRFPEFEPSGKCRVPRSNY